MIIIKAVIVTVFIGICLFIISEGINKQLEKELDRQLELNKQALELFQNEQIKTDTLYKILNHIKSQLALLGLPECPEEELKRIPFEIVGWIEQLEMISNGENNGIYK